MIVFDVEIKKAILGRGEEPTPGIEYCGGWRDFAGMGISVVCTYDIESHLSRVFLEEDLGELAVYLHKKRTAGFNTRRFDMPLLHEHGVDVDQVLHYDELEQIWLSLGLNPDKFYPKTHGGWGLDAVCQATLGIAKTGHGALAPVWWQEGRRGRVIDYCLNDVWMEGSLLAHIIKYGWVVAVGKPRTRLPLPDTVIEDQGGNARIDVSSAYEKLRTPVMDVGGVVNPEDTSESPTTSPGGLGIIR